MNFLRLGASCVVIDEQNRVLLSQRGDLKTWSTPGGRLDQGETLADCAIRETREETGIKAEIIRPVGLYYRPGWNRLNALFLARKIGGDLLGKTHETLANGFFPIDADLPAQPHTHTRISHALNGQTILNEYPFNAEEFRRLKRKFAVRYVQNLLSGHPEPRYPRFNVQAVAIIEDEKGHVLASGERYLPGVICDGTQSPWSQLYSRIMHRFGVEIGLIWRGMWQHTAHGRITFVFGGSKQIDRHPALMNVARLQTHHQHLTNLSRNTDSIFTAFR